LHVVDGVDVFYIGVKSKNHKELCDWVIGRLRD
jgi:hypothetical protein